MPSAQVSASIFAVVAMEVCSRVLARDNEVTVRWAPANHGATDKKTAGGYAKAAAEGSAPHDGVPDEYRWETSLAHMIRTAAEARSRATVG